jgi:hypothetical protein
MDEKKSLKFYLFFAKSEGADGQEERKTLKTDGKRKTKQENKQNLTSVQIDKERKARCRLRTNGKKKQT